MRLTAGVTARTARRRQERYCGTYIAVTGSVGKTTTASLIASLLAPSGSVSLGAFRNVQRPIYTTLRRLKQPTDYLVQEVSAHPIGTIGHIVHHLRIDVGVVTTVGLDHQSDFRTVERVAEEKSKLVAAVAPQGFVCLNADYPLVRAMSDKAHAKVILFGEAADADIRAQNIRVDWQRGLEFDVEIGTWRRHFKSPFLGTFMVGNLLAALAVAHGLGLELDAAAARLETIEPERDRLRRVAGADGHTYALDNLKASLWSTMVLIADLEKWQGGPKIFVLGHLSDTGSNASQKYKQALRAAAKHCDLVIGVGPAAGAASRISIAERRAVKEHGGTIPERPVIVAADTLEEARVAIESAPRGLVILKGGSIFPLKSLLPTGTVVPQYSPVGRRSSA
ncbi:MAG: Mur ligase family protein [Devosia sp.]